MPVASNPPHHHPVLTTAADPSTHPVMPVHETAKLGQTKFDRLQLQTKAANGVSTGARWHFTCAGTITRCHLIPGSLFVVSFFCALHTEWLMPNAGDKKLKRHVATRASVRCCLTAEVMPTIDTIGRHQMQQDDMLMTPVSVVSTGQGVLCVALWLERKKVAGTAALLTPNAVQSCIVPGRPAGDSQSVWVRQECIFWTPVTKQAGGSGMVRG